MNQTHDEALNKKGQHQNARRPTSVHLAHEIVLCGAGCIEERSVVVDVNASGVVLRLSAAPVPIGGRAPVQPIGRLVLFSRLGSVQPDPELIRSVYRKPGTNHTF